MTMFGDSILLFYFPDAYDVPELSDQPALQLDRISELIRGAITPSSGSQFLRSQVDLSDPVGVA